MNKLMMAVLTLSSSYIGAETYDYTIEMRESDGSVHHMGDVQVNINQEGEQVDPSNGANPALLNHIQNKIKSSYNDYNINIKLVSGVVTLNGVVKTEQDKKQIEQDVSKIEGVKKVENRLQVGSLQQAPNK